jgi:hypothetical protein
MNNDNSKQTFIAGEALLYGRRVKISGGTAVYADATDAGHGITQHGCASGSPIGVRLFNDTGSFGFEASGAIAAFAPFFAGDDGTISATGSIKLGLTKEAAPGANAEIECLLLDPEVDAEDFSVAVVDNEDGTATATVESNQLSLVRAWLSNTALGAVNPAETSVAATTGAVITSHTAHGDLECATDADGDLVLTITAADGAMHVNVSIGGIVKTATATISGN